MLINKNVSTEHPVRIIRKSKMPVTKIANSVNAMKASVGTRDDQYTGIVGSER